MAENALQILQSLCFPYLKAWPPSPLTFKDLKALTLPHYSKISLMTLPSEAPAPPPPPPNK